MATSDPSEPTCPHIRRSGITVLHGNLQSTVDIVLLHGLNGYPDTTWRHSSGFFWPWELRKHIHNARVMLYGYDADVETSLGTNLIRIRDLGGRFLQDLGNYRQEEQELNRPLIFIGHSLGGLVIKQALILAAQTVNTQANDAPLIYHSTKALVFFGTPHLGSGTGKQMRVQLLKSIASAVFTKVPPKIESALEMHSDELLNLADDFRAITLWTERHLSIYTYYETRADPKLNAVVVDIASAKIGYDKETTQSIQSTHQNMVKYKDEDDADFGNVYRKIKVSMRHALAGSLPASNQECQGIADWLSSDEYGRQHRDIYDRLQEGTGKWLLDSSEFKTWLTGSRLALLCWGMPGAGKTTITSLVVENLWVEFRSNPNVGVAFFYCTYQACRNQKPQDLLTALLKQLLQQRSSPPPAVVRSLYENCTKHRIPPSLQEILEALHSVIASSSTTFIVIDALDECLLPDGGRDKFLDAIFDLQTKEGANLFATSRNVPGILERFQGSMSLEIRASSHDVRKYVESNIARLPSFVQKKIGLEEEIKTKIIKAVDGMFLLAQFHLNSLEGKKSPKALRGALEELHTGTEAYSYAYEDAMKRIEGQVNDQEGLAKQILSWITCAKRQLTITELQHALAIEIGESELDEENLPQIEDMVSVCAGLVAVDNESGIIRLVHYTTQEYFERTRERWFPNAETDIAKICITYLSFNVFGFCFTNEEFEARLRSNILYGYTVKNWGHHARAASKDISQVIASLLTSDAKISGCSYGVTAYGPKRVNVIGLHIAAYFGLEEVCTILLKKGPYLNFKDNTFGRTPLSWAAGSGHAAIVKLLLEKGADPDLARPAEWTPLRYAAWGGHGAVVKLLLDSGVNPDHKTLVKSTPLLLAAKNGHENIVRLLLNKAADPNSIGDSARTPLSYAAENGYGGIVKLLLENNSTDPDSKDSNNQTPLWYAARKGHEVIARMLLAIEGVDPDSKSTWPGRTPLGCAAENGHETVVELLIAKDEVDPDSKNQDGETPLSLAATNGHETIAKLLLSKDRVDVNSKDSRERTPLLLAAEDGHAAIVKLLLANSEVDPNFKNQHGETPLSLAARDGHDTIVELLLAKDEVDPDSKNQHGETPLWMAATNGHDSVIKRLLATNRVDLEPKSTLMECTALERAVSEGHEAVVRLLLATGKIRINSNDSYGNRLLERAVVGGHETMVKLLLAAGQIDVNFKDSRGYTPLRSAVWLAREAIVELLLENGADPDLRDKQGQTPLSMIVKSELSRNKHQEMAMLLLALEGVDPDSKDNDGRTPLSYATENGNEIAIRFLLETGKVDLNSQDNNKRTPLLYATKRNDETIVKMLLQTGKVDPNIEDNNKQTPLLYAVKRRNERVVKMLLETSKVNPNIEDSNKRTPLSCAMEQGNVAVVKMLLETGEVDPRSKDGKSQTREVAKLPLSMGRFNIRPEYKDKKLLSSYKAIYGWDEALELLVRMGEVCRDFTNDNERMPLLPTADNGYQALAKWLLMKDEIKPTSKDRNGQTLLSWAAKKGYEEVTRILLQKGAQADCEDGFGETALHGAAERGHLEVARVLLEMGAAIDKRKSSTSRSFCGDIEHLTEKENTALHLAVMRGHERVALLLLDWGASITKPSIYSRWTKINDRYGSDYSDTTNSFNSDDEERISAHTYSKRRSKSRRKAVNVRYKKSTVLHLAAIEGQEAIVKFLLETREAEPDLKDNSGRTPLLLAAKNGHKAIVMLLLEKRANIEAKDNEGRTPLLWASENRHEAVVKLLIEKGADLESREKSGQTPLLRAAAGGREAVVQLLLEKGADYRAKDDECGRTPVFWAIENGHAAVARLLLKRDVDLNPKEKHVQTLLLDAARVGHLAVVQLLLDKGVDTESIDSDGRTPLLYAAENGRKAVVRLLLDHGANAVSMDKDGRTPLWCAAAEAHRAIVQLLESHIAQSE